MGNESNAAVLRAVNHLIDDSSANNLKVSVGALFREYLTSFDDGVFPLNYHQVVNDFYYLKDFLTKIESLDMYQPQQLNTNKPTD